MVLIQAHSDMMDFNYCGSVGFEVFSQVTCKNHFAPASWWSCVYADARLADIKMQYCRLMAARQAGAK